MGKSAFGGSQDSAEGLCSLEGLQTHTFISHMQSIKYFPAVLKKQYVLFWLRHGLYCLLFSVNLTEASVIWEEGIPAEAEVVSA